MEAITSAVKSLTVGADDAGRKKVIDGLRSMANSLETHDDSLQRLMYMHLQIAAARIGIDLKIFEFLVASKEPLTVEQLREQTGSAPVLLARLLRYLASVGMIEEIGTDKFTSNNITEALAVEGNQAGVHHMFDTVGPMFQELPDFLAKIKYQDITDNTNTPHQVAHKSQLPAFLWFVDHPEAAAYFNKYMMHRRKDQAICWDVYPVEQETKGWDDKDPVLVDIGGNIGHQCAEFKKFFPKVPGRVILEDLPGPIDMALKTEGVENLAHDMFQAQPIKGAKYYYLRHVLHDWPDDKCREILRNIISVMGSQSVILLDEMVLPDNNVHWQVTQIDLTMMAALASIERTRSHWATLLDSVGLKIEKLYTYTPSVYESIMTVVRKS